MTLTPGALVQYTLVTGERSFRLLARYIGPKPQSGGTRHQVLYTMGDGIGHVWSVIRPSVRTDKIAALEDVFARKE